MCKLPATEWSTVGRGMICGRPKLVPQQPVTAWYVVNGIARHMNEYRFYENHQSGLSQRVSEAGVELLKAQIERHP